MQSLLGPAKLARLSLPRGARHFTPSTILLQPTAIHRAEAAADLKKHPEAGVTQEKRKDVKHDHHWVEETSTSSEAIVKADREETGKESKDPKSLV